jgi:dihydrofolate reductase
MARMFEQPYDLLLGRRTYEIFAAFWPYYPKDGEDGAIAKQFDAITKYVVSRSGEVDTGWERSVLVRDIAEVERRKQGDGPALLTQGSTELVHALLARDLVDEISMFTVPIVLGAGKKLFADDAAPHAFALTRSHVCRNGVIVAHYTRKGAVPTGDMTHGAVAPTERELARRERMKREG